MVVLEEKSGDHPLGIMNVCATVSWMSLGQSGGSTDRNYHPHSHAASVAENSVYVKYYFTNLFLNIRTDSAELI